MYGKIKDVSISILCILLSVFAIKLISITDKLSDYLDITYMTTQTAINEWVSYSHQLNVLISSPKTQQSIGMFLRSGDDINRLIKRANITLDNTNGLIANLDVSLNQKFIPENTKLIAKTNENLSLIASDMRMYLDETNDQIVLTSTNVQNVLLDSQKTIVASRDAINNISNAITDPQIKSIVNNIDKTTELAVQSMKHVEEKTYQLVKPVNIFYRVLKEVGIFAWRMFKP